MNRIKNYILLYLPSFIFLFIWGCCPDGSCNCPQQDVPPVVSRNSIKIPSIIPPDENGDFSVTVLADWEATATSSTTYIEIWCDELPFCPLWRSGSETINRGGTYTFFKNMYNLYSCFTIEHTYQVKAYVSGLGGLGLEPQSSFEWGAVPINEVLVSKARGMMTGCPNWYIPSMRYNQHNGITENTSGSVSWATVGLTNRTSPNEGYNETKAHFIQRLQNATIQNQLRWQDYLCGYYENDYTKGFPFPLLNDYEFHYFGPNSFLTCCSGFICYAYVYAAALEAGYSLPYNFTGGTVNGDPWTQLLRYDQIPVGQEQIGDVVLYKHDGTNFTHTGIITVINAPDRRFDKVISSYGYLEEFNWGVKEVNLWGFRSKRIDPTYGLFISELDGGFWPQQYDSWDLSDIIIIRLN